MNISKDVSQKSNCDEHMQMHTLQNVSISIGNTTKMKFGWKPINLRTSFLSLVLANINILDDGHHKC